MGTSLLSREADAVAQERLRIARELHDVVAHAISIIAVQSAAGSRVGVSNPAEAQRAFAAISTTSRGALTEMRRMLGVLREETADDSERSPSPSLADVPELMSQAAGGGLEATLHIDGTPIALPSAMELSGYRIVQEALTNAIKHGGSPVIVQLSYTSSDLIIRVVSENSTCIVGTPKSHLQGHGITGMRERVAAFGGDFSASARAEGGFEVRARLPLHGSNAGRPGCLNPTQPQSSERK